VGRNEDKLKKVAEELSGDITICTADITETQSITRLAKVSQTWSEHIDIIVNVSGYDVRKSLNQHSYEEIKKSLDVNLYGAILITRVFLPYMNQKPGSTIVHIGGFADGRMAFPYYSADVASRAGLYSFIESINRELVVERSKIRVSYFCPSPADTEAERPYHPLWRKMGISILTVDQVSSALLKMIEKNKTVSIMGGFLTVFFAKLNSVFPRLADVIVMKSYGIMLREYLNYVKSES
jgi:short-subunit dehydrogenase